MFGAFANWTNNKFFGTKFSAVYLFVVTVLSLK